jgi:hypothetical protein
MFAMSLSFAAIAAAPAAAALTGTPDEIGDRLIQSIIGYEPLPEGGVLGDSSGPLTPGDLTELVGIDPADLPTDWDGGYLRMFATPRGDGYALAIGVDFAPAADVLAGFRDAATDAGQEFQLFPDDRTALGDTVAYEITSPGTDATLVTTAFASGSLTVVLGVADPDDSIAVLQEMARDQVEITPPATEAADTAPSAETSTTSDGRSVGYRLGQVLGSLFVFGLLFGLPAWLLLRQPHRKRRDAHSTVETDLHATECRSGEFTPPPPTPEKPPSPPGW